jgi:hypothetical protein
MAEPGTDDDFSARAAEVAADVSEAEPREQRRMLETFTRAATSGARAAGRGTRAVRRGAGSGTRALQRRAGPITSGTQVLQRRAGPVVSGTRAARDRARAGSNWLAGQVIAMVPRLRVRDQAALRAQFPGKSADEIADALIEGATRAAAATGGMAGVWAALPVLPAFPVEVAGETLVLVGIEVKLIAELHEAYGMPAPGKFPERMSSYLAAWAHRRGVSMIPGVPGGVVFAAGSPLARLLRRRLAARAGRSAFSLGPLLTGAAAGAVLNRRETRRLGEAIRRDLRVASITPPRALRTDHRQARR